MHPSPVFHEHDRQRLVETARAHPFALVVGVKDGRPHAAHTPVRVGETTSGSVELRFHLANANPVAAALRASGQALVVFTGPHAYVSPDWYGQGDQVPTWNYLSVEAEGPVTVLDETETTALLDALAAEYESGLAPKPAWTRDRIAAAKFERMLPAITGFRLVAARFDGIRKLNQNKPQNARKGVIAALESRADGLAIADEMRKLDP